MKKKVYIDGQAGTTGLQIHERLKNRKDVELLEIDPEKRKDPDARRQLMEEADLVFLCLPDAAAKEAAALMDGLDTKIIDASTAHRTHPDWTYGFAQLHPGQKDKIRQARKVANPGCHASGFIALVHPLIASGLLDPDTRLTSFSLTGYSGGGRKMIEAYEQGKDEPMYSPKPYALGLNHKHLPEMQTISGLNKAPLFVPVVDDFKQGMLVQVFVDTENLENPKTGQPVSADDLLALYQDWYKDTPITVYGGESALYSSTLAGSDRMELFVNGNTEGFILSARFDNLGKGASGAAVENMNLMLGLDEEEGLHLD